MSALETIDYKSRNLYHEQSKDTTRIDALDVTFEVRKSHDRTMQKMQTHKVLPCPFCFQPVLKTFEMDIMDEMGITEDRIPKKFYWY